MESSYVDAGTPLVDSVRADPERQWHAARQFALERDNWTCVGCAETRATTGLDVHHVIPRKDGGGDEAANLITLCDGCHGARHPNLQVRLSARILRRWALRMARYYSTAKGNSETRLTGLFRRCRHSGWRGFGRGQPEVILAALRGHSVLAVRPTGGGKSLCFQTLPSLLRLGTALVVAPLKALMSDQVAKLQQTKVPATFINSDLGPNEKRARLRLLEESVFKLLYCAPERFNPDLVRPEEVERLLAQLHPSYLVIDEAHCVDRWGDSFRPDYARLGELRERLGNPPVLAFTATATEQTQQRILKSLGLPEAQILVSGVDRRNIAFVRHKIRGFADRRASFIVPIVSRLQETGGKAMIFVPTIKIGEELQAALATEGVELPFYHAKFGTATERENLIGRFTGRLGPPLQAVICTNAFGMGIDVDDVRVVIHWQHPGSAVGLPPGVRTWGTRREARARNSAHRGRGLGSEATGLHG